MKPAQLIETEILPPQKSRSSRREEAGLATVANSLSPAEQRAPRILSYHQGGRRAAGQQVVFAYLAGVELLAAKEEVERGAFMKWCQEHVAEIPHRSITRYMAFAEQLQTEVATIADLDLPKLQLTNGEAQAAQIEKVAEAIKEVADGKTLTELYRGFGLIREPQKPQYNPPKRTAEEIEAEAEAAARDFLQTISGDLETFVADTASHSRLKTPDLKEALNHALTFTKTLRTLIKARGKGGAKKPTKKGKK